MDEVGDARIERRMDTTSELRKGTPQIERTMQTGQGSSLGSPHLPWGIVSPVPIPVGKISHSRIPIRSSLRRNPRVSGSFVIPTWDDRFQFECIDFRWIASVLAWSVQGFDEKWGRGRGRGRISSGTHGNSGSFPYALTTLMTSQIADLADQPFIMVSNPNYVPPSMVTPSPPTTQ
ncbi:hypothetical protein Ahy_A06g027396 isoform B [Arachis hypogaea]|uniref:Uncharacterized protein n=1 Tax=Arachis hypogaea TaxID=3818 RepID=A0A445CNI7_ARAHY|nr:hypothetical protein Ahy_A06g027396 isoform B [Arachis hypogaea]